MKSKLFLVLMLLVSSLAAAEDPKWLKSPPPPDALNLYFTGISEPQENLQKALESARAHAVAVIIRELFGTKIKIDLKTAETLSESKAVKRFGEESQTVQISDLRQVDMSIQKEASGTQTAYVLYAYSKSAYEIEKSRLQYAPDRFSPITLISVDEEKKSEIKVYPVQEKFLVKQLDFYKFREDRLWIVGLEISYLTNTFDQGKPIKLYGARLERIYETSSLIRFGAAVSVSKINADYKPQNPNDANQGSGDGYAIGLSAPVYIFSGIHSSESKTFSETYLAPEIAYLNYEFRLKSNIGYSNASEVKTQIKQYYYGLAFGYNFFTIGGWGLNVSTSYGSYLGSHSSSGSRLSGGISYNF